MRSLPACLLLLCVCAGILAVGWRYQHSRAPHPAPEPSRVRTDAESSLAALRDRLPAGALTPALAATLAHVAARPASTDAWLILGDALLQRSRDLADPALYATVERAYRQARQLDATNADALAGLAWAAAACHRFEDAVAWATLALQADPELSVAYGILGDAAVELGRYDEAEAHYQRMIDLRPDVGAYSRAAHLLYLRGQSDRAIELMRLALRTAGPDAEPTGWCVAELAMMLCRTGRVPEAVALCDRALARAPHHGLLLNAAAYAHGAAGESDVARRLYERSVALQPQHTALAALYDLHRAAGRTDAADRVATQLEQLHQRLMALGVRGGEGQLARFWADTGRHSAKAVTLAEYEHTHHRTAASADALAWAYFGAGRAGDAARVAAELLRYDALEASMLYHAGRIAEATGSPGEAARHLAAALRREPRFSPVDAPEAVAALIRVQTATRTSLPGPAQPVGSAFGHHRFACQP